MKVEVKWETDGEKVDLPSVVDIPQEVVDEWKEEEYHAGDSDYTLTEYLSNTYGFLVNHMTIL